MAHDPEHIYTCARSKDIRKLLATARLFNLPITIVKNDEQLMEFTSNATLRQMLDIGTVADFKAFEWSLWPGPQMEYPGQIGTYSVTELIDWARTRPDRLQHSFSKDDGLFQIKVDYIKTYLAHGIITGADVEQMAKALGDPGEGDIDWTKKHLAQIEKGRATFAKIALDAHTKELDQQAERVVPSNALKAATDLLASCTEGRERLAQERAQAPEQTKDRGQGRLM